MEKNLSNAAYIRWLNEFAPEYESEEWIMDGKRRERFAQSRNYGGCVKKHDPIRFEVGYGDWKRNVEYRNQ